MTSATVESLDVTGREQATERRRIRVAFVIDNMQLGGTELNAVRTAERLDRQRCELSVLCIGADGPLSERYRAMGIPVVHLPLQSFLHSSMLTCGLRFVRHLREERVDVVHAHDVYSNIFATVWARLARTPVVIASRRWWHDLPNGKLRIGNSVAFRLADAVLANSAQLARSVHESVRLPDGRVWTVTNFADDEAFTPMSDAARAGQRRSWGIPEGATVIGCVARLNPVKDHRSLVQAFAAVRAGRPEAHLVLVGDGECRSALEQQVRDLRIERAVTFTGELHGGGNHHRAFDVSTLASLSEGFPNTLVEAMAAARPVVATAVGGTMDAVDDGVTGLLVAADSADALASALDRVVRSEPLRRRLGTAGLARASADYRATPTVLALQAMYDTLLSRARVS